MMMIPIIFLLLLFAGAAVLGLIVFAIVSKKLWVLPAVAALLFLGLVATGLVFVGFPTHSTVSVQMAPMNQVAQQMIGMTHTVVQGQPIFNAYVSGPNWTRILILGLLIAFLIGLVARRGLSPAAFHGLRRTWRVGAAILIIAVIFLFKLRSAYTVTHESATLVAPPELATEMAAQQRAVVAIQQRAADEIRMQQQLAQSDIQKEIDQFDAPHIPIPPDAAPAEGPAAPAKPAAATKTNKDTKKPIPAATHKRRKSDKTPTTGDTKQPQSIANSKSAQDKLAVKENTASTDKSAIIAEAEPEKPKPRPTWVDELPKRTGNTRREVIATDPYATVDECYQAADVYLMMKTYQRIQELIGKPYTDGALPPLTFRNGQLQADGQIVSYGSGNSTLANEHIRSLESMGLGIDYVRREIVAKDPKSNESREYVETVEQSFGPMKKLYLQIEFTPAIDRELRQHWDAHQRTERFAMVGVGAGSILGLLGMVFGLLKIDTWTKGYYTKRLFIVLPAAIITGCLLLSLLLTRHAIYR